MRCQLSIEVFFVFAVLSLALIWFSNYANLYYPKEGNSAALINRFSQEKTVANNLANLLNLACVHSLEINYSLPCILSGSSGAYYSIESSGTNSIIVYTSKEESYAKANASCLIEGSASSGCKNIRENTGETICIKGIDGKAFFSNGECK